MSMDIYIYISYLFHIARTFWTPYRTRMRHKMINHWYTSFPNASGNTNWIYMRGITIHIYRHFMTKRNRKSNSQFVGIWQHTVWHYWIPLHADMTAPIVASRLLHNVIVLRMEYRVLNIDKYNSKKFIFRKYLIMMFNHLRMKESLLKLNLASSDLTHTHYIYFIYIYIYNRCIFNYTCVYNIRYVYQGGCWNAWT